MSEAYQLWQGDCLELMWSLPDASVDMVHTDIPYNEVNRHSSGLRGLDKGVADSSPVELSALWGHINRVCVGTCYIWCGQEQVSDLRRLARTSGWSVRVGVWEKTNPSPMNGQHLWLSSIELCVYAKRSGASHNELCKSPVWRGPHEEYLDFPCPKPLWLVQRLIRASSRSGDTVLDPYAGSCSTGEAALREGRRFIGIELDEHWYNVAKARLEKYSRAHIPSLFAEVPA